MKIGHFITSLLLVALASGFAAAATIESKIPEMGEDGCFKIGTAAELFGFMDSIGFQYIGHEYVEIGKKDICGRLTDNITINENLIENLNKASTDEDFAEEYFDSLVEFCSTVAIDSVVYIRNFLAGDFHGGGYTISGVYCAQNFSYSGLFGGIDNENLDDEVVIDSLTIVDSYFANTANTGAVLGEVLNGNVVIRDVHAMGNSILGYYANGGLVGYIYNDTKVKIVNSSVSNTEISNSYYIGGGLVGINEGELTIKGTSFEGNLQNGATIAGGFVAQSADRVFIDSSFARSNINAQGSSGGFIGRAGSAVSISRSHFWGEVQNGSPIGAFIGLAEDTVTIDSSYADAIIRSGNNIGGFVGISVEDAWISNSYFEGSVLGDRIVGGFIGLLYDIVKIENSHVKGTVRASSERGGGFVGWTQYSGWGIRNSYFDGNIYCGGFCGGFIGESFGGEILNSYANFALLNVPSIVGSFLGSAGGNVSVINSYSKVELNASEFNASNKAGGFMGMENRYEHFFDNSFYLETEYKAGDSVAYEGVFGISEEDFRNGKLATALHGYVNDSLGVDGEIWGQNFDVAKGEVDTLPVFSGEINYIRIQAFANNAESGVIEGLNETGEYIPGDTITLTAVANEGYRFSDWQDDVEALAERTIVASESRTFTANFEVALSSSESSSSETESSSSGKVASSSSAQPGNPATSSSAKAKSSSSSRKAVSSSSAKSRVKSSSSSAKAKSSSSSRKGKDAVVAAVQLPLFGVAVENRMVQVSGIVAGTHVSLLDMQGRVLDEFFAPAASFEIRAPQAGVYFLRVGSCTRSVRIK